MRTLALDTSTELGTVAVLVDGVLVSEISARVRASHGEALLPHVEQALRQAQVEPGELDLVAVGIGPGSFTGLRVGVAAAKGICLATGAPLRGVVSLRAMARALFGVAHASAPWAVAVADAHKGEVFVGAWRASGAGELDAVAPFHGPPLEVARELREAIGDEHALVCGGGARRYPVELAEGLGPAHTLAPAVFDAPRAALIALEGERALQREGPSDLAALEPLYVRPSDAKLPETPLKIERG